MNFSPACLHFQQIWAIKPSIQGIKLPKTDIFDLQRDFLKVCVLQEDFPLNQVTTVEDAAVEFDSRDQIRFVSWA